MQLKRLALLAFAGLASAQQAADPITDRLRLEIVLSQRNLLAKLREADEACFAVGKKFDLGSLACIEAKTK